MHHTTAFVTPVVEHWLERVIAQWVHPMKDRSNDPSHHERTLLPYTYTSADCYCRDLVIVILNNGSPVNYLCFSESKTGDLVIVILNNGSPVNYLCFSESKTGDLVIVILNNVSGRGDNFNIYLPSNCCVF